MSIFKYVLLCVLAGTLFGCSNPESHEKRSEAFYQDIQKQLKDFAEKKDTNGLQFLTAHLDAQLKVEEFLIRSREAGHPKFALFGSILSTALTAFISVVTTLITMHVRRTPADEK